jgi:DNA-binding SARP family transcriptional activator
VERLEFGILGPPDARDGDGPVTLPAGKPRALLALLLLHGREVMSTFQLVEGLWGEHAPATALKNVQIYISDLRKAIGYDAITTVGHGYAVEIELDQLDLHRFERLLEEGRKQLAAADARAAADHLGEALALWRAGFSPASISKHDSTTIWIAPPAAPPSSTSCTGRPNACVIAASQERQSPLAGPRPPR